MSVNDRFSNIVQESVGMTMDPMKHQVCAWTEKEQVCRRATLLSLTTTVKNITLLSTTSMDESKADDGLELKARGSSVSLSLPRPQNNRGDDEVKSIVLGSMDRDEYGWTARPLVCVQNMTLGKKRVDFMPFAVRSRNSFVTFSDNVSYW